MKVPIKVCCIGMGQRGFAYFSEMKRLGHDKFEFVAICETNKDRIKEAKKEFGIKTENVFTDENKFFKEKKGDLCVVATQDQDHVRHAIKALELGYDVLCEKPISNKESEVRRLLEAQRKYQRKVFICHVLRYAPAFKKVKELLEAGTIGRIVTIDSIENVQILHYCHSYIRGNWRNSNLTSPIILAKCCHDLDLLTWYAGDLCKSISSIGEQTFFVASNKPEGAADRCKDCKYHGKCPFDAYSSYLKWGFWGKYLITDERPVTDLAIIKALDEGPYGRCVFACDNNNPETQLVQMQFGNGITAHLRMMGLSSNGGRIMKFYGTYGQIDLNETEGKIDVMPFGKEKETISISSLVSEVDGHGGGDSGLIYNIYKTLTEENSVNKDITFLAASVESHLMGFAAEESRLNGGKLVTVDHNK